MTSTTAISSKTPTQIYQQQQQKTEKIQIKPISLQHEFNIFPDVAISFQNSFSENSIKKHILETIFINDLIEIRRCVV